MINTFSYTQEARENIYNIISSINPPDEVELAHINDTLAWIESGLPIFRTCDPAIQVKHLVSYFTLFDHQHSKILLVNHKKAQLWLPPGGHIEINEDPKETVRRECLEELNSEADFLYEQPIFLTSTLTVGQSKKHIDVSLWPL